MFLFSADNFDASNVRVFGHFLGQKLKLQSQTLAASTCKAQVGDFWPLGKIVKMDASSTERAFHKKKKKPWTRGWLVGKLN